MHVTSPYLEGPGPSPCRCTSWAARKRRAAWSSTGPSRASTTSRLTRTSPGTTWRRPSRKSISAARKITGHLCSIGFREAAALGIDNLEHGLLVDTEFAAGQEARYLPIFRTAREALLKLEVSGSEIQETIRDLVAHKVAVTSTLPVFEISVPGRPPLQPRVLEAMAPETRIVYLTQRARVGESKTRPYPPCFKKEMEFEREFVKAGGLLIAGPDPTGYGGVLPGFGDQRGVELLVEAGFTPVEAIKIATHNGALYLGELDRIGTLAAGKQADMVLIKGNPAKDIADIEKVETVFKDGIGYDPAKLIEAARGVRAFAETISRHGLGHLSGPEP